MWLATLLASNTPAFAVLSYSPSAVVPPEPLQEFRGVWVATVDNIDWPSRRGLSTEQQKTELLSIFDRAVQLKLNAIILQIRPQCDALYASPFEPWSEFLTGKMGQAPWPYYDPLAFAVEEAHRRGLELHAWFNPYRALHPRHAGPIATNHVTQSRPELVRKYGKYRWLDPGEREVQEYSLQVVMDVVKRYDIDGVHFDDYFYLTPVEAGVPPNQDFPDDASWRKQGGGQRLSRADWRRANVDAFIERTYHAIKKAKPWVKFGVSPRGIWRPGFPPQIKKAGDAYADAYADSRKWFVNGWLDYFSPQLYWPIEPPDQSFSALLNWWAVQGQRKRHLWPGLAAYRAGAWAPDEIANQISVGRNTPGVMGHIFYNTTSLMSNAALTNALAQTVYAEPALVPACPWLSPASLGAPTLRASRRGPNLVVTWQLSGSVRGWVLQSRHNGQWTTRLLPAQKTSEIFFGPNSQMPELLTVRAIDRAGNLGTTAGIGKRAGPFGSRDSPSNPRATTVGPPPKDVTVEIERDTNHTTQTKAPATKRTRLKPVKAP